jgi:hypothetical protein
MITDDKATTLIVKLNRLTSLEQITWHVDEPPRTILRGTDDYIPLFIVTEYKGKRFAMFQQRYQSFSMEMEQQYWAERIVLAILDDEGRVLWEEYTRSPALYDLFETARRKVSKIDSVIDDLISDDDMGDETHPKF